MDNENAISFKKAQIELSIIFKWNLKKLFLINSTHTTIQHYKSSSHGFHVSLFIFKKKKLKIEQKKRGRK